MVRGRCQQKEKIPLSPGTLTLAATKDEIERKTF
jgi:hypothetical protein